MRHGHIESLVWVRHDSTKETAFRSQLARCPQTTKDGTQTSTDLSRLHRITSDSSPPLGLQRQSTSSPEGSGCLVDETWSVLTCTSESTHFRLDDDDDVYYYICERLKLEGDTHNTVWATVDVYHYMVGVDDDVWATSDSSVPRAINFRGRIRNCRDQPSWPMRGGRGDVTEREFTLTQSEVASVRAELQSTRATLIKTEAS